MVFGDLAIKLSAACAVIAFVAAVRWAGGHSASERTFRWAYHAMTATLALASALLLAAILTHDFRFSYVVGYTSRDLPLLYLLSAFWAGQQGTYLLWALFGAAAGYLLMRRRSWEPAWVMACWVPTVAFLHALMLDPNGNPFRLAAQVPPDGRGLNPLLQDPWMASHPPLVFLGYVAMTVPAVLAAVALVRRREDAWLAPALRWALASFVLLGAGIVLGGFWAYKVLGWGGYWGWDPVENASLIPWLVVTALLHGLLVQKGTGALVRTNLALALGGYVLVFYATFLTRSGVLADFSVHSFPAGSIFKVLLGIQLLIVAASALAFVGRRGTASKDLPGGLAWPLVLTSALALLGISAGMVLVGTSWPILSSWVGKPAAFGPSWYNTVSLPLYVVLVGLLGVGPYLAWRARPTPFLLRRVVPTAAIAAAVTVLAVLRGAHGAGALVLLFVAAAALTANLWRFVEVARVRPLHTGAAVAHIGFALMFVGIVASGVWGDRSAAVLPLGEPVDVLGRTLTFRGHVPGSEPQDRWAVEVTEPGGRTIETSVAMFRLGGGRDEVMHKPAILRHVDGDLYIAPASLETVTPDRDVRLVKGEPVEVAGVTLTFSSFETEASADGHGMTVWAHVRVRSGDAEEMLRLPFTMAGGRAESAPVSPTVADGITSLTLQRMFVEQAAILVHASTAATTATQVLSVEVSTKPLIGALWLGTVLLGIGCSTALARRWADARMVARAEAAAREAAAAAAPARGSGRRGRRRAHARSAAAG